MGAIRALSRGLSRWAVAVDLEVTPDPEDLSGEWVLLLPLRECEGSAERTAREASILRALEGRELPFRIPQIVALDPDEGGLVLTWLDAIPLTHKRSGSYRLIARVAASLHSLDPAGLEGVLGGYATEREHAEAEIEPLHELDFPEGRDALAWALEHLPPPSPSSFLHGDLLGQNLLHPSDRSPTEVELREVGVIDWERATRGDPAYDLAITTRGTARPFGKAGHPPAHERLRGSPPETRCLQPGSIFTSCISSGAGTWNRSGASRGILPTSIEPSSGASSAEPSMPDEADMPTPSDALDAIRAGAVDRLRELLAEEPGLVEGRVDGLEYEPGKRPMLLHAVLLVARDDRALPVAELVRALLDAGADVRAGDRDPVGNTALALAAVFGHLDVVDLLVEAGAPVEDGDLDEYGMAAIDHALYGGGGLPAALRLAALGAEITPMRAAGLGRIDGMERARAELDEDVGLRAGCLLTAAMCGQEAAIRWLAEIGTDLDLFPPGSDFAGIGASALHWAAGSGHDQVVRFLLERGADPGQRDDVFGKQPVGWAYHGGHDGTAPDPPPMREPRSTSPARPSTATSIASGEGLERDPSALHENAIGASPIRAAASGGHLEVVRFLLGRGADPTIPSPDGKTALDRALDAGHEPIATLLREGMDR